MEQSQLLLFILFGSVAVGSSSTTTPPSGTGNRSDPYRHHVCVPCSTTPLANQTGLSFSRNESVFSGGCATLIHAGVSKFTETALFSTNAFSVLHLLECITESLATNGSFFCSNGTEAVACDNSNLTVIAFCHNTTLAVEPHHPLAAIEWAAALYTAITLVGIFTLNYV
uniref:GP4 protein n=1 Tax=Free State vervet virus TaxID=1737586 RepID=A0A159D7F0_9NIDO|nr:GP4 protein [Free State vervet virus]